MKTYRGVLLVSAVLLVTVPLSGCGNALDGGSSPSGSYITASSSTDSLEPDIYLTTCSTSTDEDGLVTYEYEDGLTNTYATVTLYNNSTPNTPDDTSTNQDVTMSRYRVDFTGVNKTVSIPSLDGPSLTVRVPKDESASMTVLLMDLATLEYIRSHYSNVGKGESLTLRATVTIWGEDPFKVTVRTEAEFTLVVDDYNRC